MVAWMIESRDNFNLYSTSHLHADRTHTLQRSKAMLLLAGWLECGSQTKLARTIDSAREPSSYFRCVVIRLLVLTYPSRFLEVLPVTDK